MRRGFALREGDISVRNLLAIAKELEKQLLTFAETNSSILCHVEKLDDEANKNGKSVDVWGKASRFYYCIDTVKESIFPDAVRGSWLSMSG